MTVLSSNQEALIEACLYALGLLNSPSPTLSFFIAATACVHIGLVPRLWPGKVLPATLDNIEAAKARLHEEAAHRKTVAMYDICIRGIASLEVYVVASSVLSQLTIALQFTRWC